MRRRHRVLAAALATTACAATTATTAGAQGVQPRDADVAAVRALGEKFGRASVHGRPAGTKVCAWLTDDAQRRFLASRKAKGGCAKAWDAAVAPARRTARGRKARYALLSTKALRTGPATTPEQVERIAIRLRSIVTSDGRTTRTEGRLVFQRVAGVWKIDVVD